MRVRNSILILLVALIATVLSMSPAFASGDDDDNGKPPKPPVVQPAPEYEGNATHHLLGYAAVGAVMTKVFQNSEHPVLYGFASTLAIAAAQEASRDGPFDGRNMKYNAAGAALGAVGLGIVIGPKYLGWQRTW